jgi:hypothetical protein
MKPEITSFFGLVFGKQAEKCFKLLEKPEQHYEIDLLFVCHDQAS